jgi:hypothetical protein
LSVKNRGGEKQAVGQRMCSRAVSAKNRREEASKQGASLAAGASLASKQASKQAGEFSGGGGFSGGGRFSGVRWRRKQGGGLRRPRTQAIPLLRLPFPPAPLPYPLSRVLYFPPARFPARALFLSRAFSSRARHAPSPTSATTGHLGDAESPRESTRGAA